MRKEDGSGDGEGEAIIPDDFERSIRGASQTRAKRDWSAARMQANRERDDDIRGRIEQMELQIERMWGEIEELKQQYPILVEKSDAWSVKRLMRGIRNCTMLITARTAR
jgi:hypothetical protein